MDGCVRRETAIGYRRAAAGYVVHPTAKGGCVPGERAMGDGRAAADNVSHATTVQSVSTRDGEAAEQGILALQAIAVVN